MKLKVLFIGNSHTYLHYMPQMLVQLVKAVDRGFDLQVDQSVGEGVSLAWHWNNEPSREKINGEKWDFIVLQDRSLGPLEELHSFQRHARLLDAEIKRFGAKPIFFMTWANRDRPDTQSILTEAYSRIANELDATLAPVGLAWQKAQNEAIGLELHHKDGRHANPFGAYLTACVFYSVLYRKSPESLPATLFIEDKMRPEQDQAQALLLQKVAWETVRSAEVGMRNCELGRRRSEGGTKSGLSDEV